MSLSLYSLNVVLEVVKRTDKDGNHLLVNTWDVVPNHEDDSTELASDRDSILCVHLLLLVGGALSNQVPVDHARLNAASQLDQELTSVELGVSEVCEGSLGLNFLVSPGEKICISLASNNFIVVDTHDLPDHGKDVLLDAFTNILSANTYHTDTKGFHSVLSQVTVMVVVEHVLGNHLGFGPVDRGFVDAMANAQDNETVTDFLEKILNEAVLDLHRVDPETKSTLLTRARDIIVDDTTSLNLISSQLLKTVLNVEDCGDKH